jgi:hypothetical protein
MWLRIQQLHVKSYQFIMTFFASSHNFSEAVDYQAVMALA